MTDRRLRAAIVGMGRWGRVLVDSVQGRSETIRFVAGTTRTPVTAAEYAGRQGMTLLPSLASVLADPRVDAVVLATPHADHHAQILECLAAGRHVFVEKPMVMTCAAAEEVLSVAARGGLHLCVGHNRRLLPAYRALSDLAANALGQILQRTGNFSAPAVFPAGHWRSLISHSPAGGMTAMGIHVLDAMIGLGSRVRSVTVAVQNRNASSPEDAVTALLHNEDGTLGILTTMVETAPIWRLEVFGTAGWAAMDGERRLVHAPVGMPVRICEFAPTDIERAELEAFACAIAGKAEYPVTTADALHGIAVFEAICMAASGPDAIRSRPVGGTRCSTGHVQHAADDVSH